MEEIVIRLATTSDVPALAVLRLGLRSQPAMNVETDATFLKRCEAWMIDALDRPEWRCWVAVNSDSGRDRIRPENPTTDQSLVGALWLQLVEKIPNPTSEAERLGYITNFFVTESARGHGLGSRILDEALDWCRKNSVHSVILWPTDRSRSLYQRHGFDIPKGLFELTLGAPR